MGTFDLELDPPLNLSLLSFDVVSTPSTPEISVGVSENGVTFSPAANLALNGYRINAWLVPATVRFVRLAVRGAYRYAGGVLARPKTRLLAIHMPVVTWPFRCRQGAPPGRPGGAPDAAEAGVERWRRKGGKGPVGRDGRGREKKCVPRGWACVQGALRGG